MRRVIAAAAVMAGSAALWIAPVVSAPPAQACVWDAAWFFLHQCNEPPAAPPLPPEQQQASRTNPNGIPWWWEESGSFGTIRHWCPPECL
jgi:hypothetical protein